MPSTGGRPRDDGIDDALVDAVTELVSEKGFAAATVARVAKLAGTTKPAFYRRFAQIADMVPTIVMRRHGDLPGIDTGSIAGDLLAFQTFQSRIFGDTFVKRSMAGWLAHLAGHPEQSAAFVDQFLGTRLQILDGILRRAVDRGEIADGYRASQVMDALVGPLLMRSLMPGLGVIDEAIVEESVGTALAVLGVTRH